MSADGPPFIPPGHAEHEVVVWTCAATNCGWQTYGTLHYPFGDGVCATDQDHGALRVTEERP